MDPHLQYQEKSPRKPLPIAQDATFLLFPPLLATAQLSCCSTAYAFAHLGSLPQILLCTISAHVCSASQACISIQGSRSLQHVPDGTNTNHSWLQSLPALKFDALGVASCRLILSQEYLWGLWWCPKACPMPSWQVCPMCMACMGPLYLSSSMLLLVAPHSW